MITTDFDSVISERMRTEHRALAARWFERLLDLLPVEARDVFPTESLLDHIPSLILEISAYLQHPEQEAIAANTAILQKAQELGALRHGQRASLHQVLREYQVLSDVLVSFVLEAMGQLGAPPPASDSVALVSRLHESVNVLSQATVETFVTLYTRTIADQNERLEQFTRMAAHEWRQPLGALRTGVSLLGRSELDAQRREQTLAAVERTVQHLVDLTHKLEAVARMNTDGDTAVIQEVSSSTIAHEAARQLREMADARGIEIQVADDLPALTVDVGRLELVFVNLLSNAIKYSDPLKSVRRVEITGTSDSDNDGRSCRIEIRDNGVGIPEHARATIFQQFTRAHADRDDLSHISGIGLGLAIVADCVRAMSGRIEVWSNEGEGTAFVLTLPRVLND